MKQRKPGDSPEPPFIKQQKNPAIKELNRHKYLPRKHLW